VRSTRWPTPSDELLVRPDPSLPTLVQASRWGYRRAVTLFRAAVSVTLIATALAVSVGPSALPAHADDTGASWRVYVTNEISDDVSTFLNSDRTSITTVPAGNTPLGVAYAPDGQTAYVSDNGASTVRSYDKAGAATGTPITVGTYPYGIAVSPTGATAYVARFFAASIVPINLASRTSGAPITVGDFPAFIAISPDGQTAYVPDNDANTVVPVAVATGIAGTPIPVGTEPFGIAITPDGSTLYVANSGDNTVTPISAVTRTAGAPIPVGTSPFGVAISPDGTSVYVANRGSNSVTPITIATNTVRTAIPVGANPQNIAITPDGAIGYVTNFDSDTVSVVDLATAAVIATLPVGDAPMGIAVAPDQAPIATFTITPPAASGQPARFDAAASTVEYGTIATYAWDFGDGQTATSTTPQVAHTYANPGTYTVTLTEITSAGTSTTQVFTGATTLRNGGASARVARTLVVPAVVPPPARGTPQIRTHTTDRRVIPGEGFADRVHVVGLAAGTTVPATGSLYGPFTSRSTASCRAERLARAVKWQARNGWTRSPSVSISAPGVYVWRVSTAATARNRAGTHRCGLDAETTTVAKPTYAVPLINGGFSGTLREASPRSAPTLLRVPALGIRAGITAVGIRRGRMVLPGDVRATGWLRRSAGYGDAIGTTVVAGHVSDRRDRPGAMERLSDARRGQIVVVTVGSLTYRYRVLRTATYPRGHRLPKKYFATTGPHRLVLVSCTDRVVHADGRFHYTRYQVVVAKQVGSPEQR